VSDRPFREHVGAPPILEGLEDHLAATAPLTQPVGAGAVGVVDDGAVEPGGRQVVGVVDGERREGDLRQERRVGVAEFELDGQVIDRLDGLELARVGLAVVGARLAVDLTLDGVRGPATLRHAILREHRGGRASQEGDGATDGGC
jgi:hypothetical protein